MAQQIVIGTIAVAVGIPFAASFRRCLSPLANCLAGITERIFQVFVPIATEVGAALACSTPRRLPTEAGLLDPMPEGFARRRSFRGGRFGCQSRPALSAPERNLHGRP